MLEVCDFDSTLSVHQLDDGSCCEKCNFALRSDFYRHRHQQRVQGGVLARGLNTPLGHEGGLRPPLCPWQILR